MNPTLGLRGNELIVYQPPPSPVYSNHHQELCFFILPSSSSSSGHHTVSYAAFYCARPSLIIHHQYCKPSEVWLNNSSSGCPDDMTFSSDQSPLSRSLLEVASQPVQSPSTSTGGRVISICTINQSTKRG